MRFSDEIFSAPKSVQPFQYSRTPKQNKVFKPRVLVEVVSGEWAARQTSYVCSFALAKGAIKIDGGAYRAGLGGAIVNFYNSELSPRYPRR
ncbi:hypothetical protein EVAR_38014_1 [Eumeta japonica]|uniref:Uncharacterized protein n=1 Tax=Eumeta variegata TaxID=151549 RepID=A0A4C1WW44_EUMVA|nr:hypothetical protein EVAR_38014_1 [Eumeta japonica]